MTDLLIPLASPNPATTDWVPLGNTGSVPTTQPSVRVTRAAALSIPNATWTAVPWDTLRWDKGPSPQWSAGSPTRLTCQVAGTYLIWTNVQFNQGAGGVNRIATISLNGFATTLISGGGTSALSVGASGFPQVNISTFQYLNVGDYVESNMYHDAGGALAANVGSGSNQQAMEFGMALLGGQQGPPGFASPPTYATTLPASPVDGQEAILVDSVTNPWYAWRLRYNAGSTSPYKWEYVGGTPWMGAAYGGTWQQFSGNSTFVGASPNFTTPRAGDYWLAFTAQFNTTASGVTIQMGYGTATIMGVAQAFNLPSPSEIRWAGFSQRVNAFAQGAVVQPQVWADKVTTALANMETIIYPARVS